jgi:hypothetical protein
VKQLSTLGDPSGIGAKLLSKMGFGAVEGGKGGLGLNEQVRNKCEHVVLQSSHLQSSGEVGVIHSTFNCSIALVVHVEKRGPPSRLPHSSRGSLPLSMPRERPEIVA